MQVGGYELVSLLGKGGFGEVWRARDPALGRDVALKILRHDDPEEIARFRREAQTSASLSHPNIAAVYEARDNYIALQLIDGGTLRPGPDAVRCVRDAARAVAYAHERGVVHRDLKPANIMVDRDGRTFVMDFGLARQLRAGASLTVSGMLLGTPAYMSPEQAQGRRADARSDVYSLGVTLYEMLAGRPPFESPNLVGLLARVVSEDPAPLKGRGDLNTIVLKCLEKDPARRYPSAAAFADDLDRWLAGEPIRAHPPAFLYLLRKRLAKRRALIALGAVGLALCAALAVVLVPRLRSAQRKLTSTEQQLVDDMRELTDAHLRTALSLRRAGSLREMLEVVPKAERVCRECVARLPRLAEPHLRLGRIYRAAMRFDDAMVEQD